VWRDDRLDWPQRDAAMGTRVLLAITGRLAARAIREQRAVADTLAELRGRLSREERWLVEATRFIGMFIEYRLRSRRPSTDVTQVGSRTEVESGASMSDDRVLQAAQADEANTQRRIEELKQEVQRAEARLGEITEFIRKYRDYEASAQ
jgi:hypothetical protein